MAAAEIVKYVDPDASGNGDGNSWANAYTSMSAVEALNYNLTTQGGGDGSWLHVYFRSLSGTADTTALTWSGWVTSATCYILLEAASGYRAHAEHWDTACYRLSLANSTALNIGSGCDHMILDGLQIEVTGSNASNQIPLYVGSKAAGNSIKVRNCRIQVAAGSGYSSSCVYFSDADLSGVQLWNCYLHAHPSNAGTIDGFYFNGTSAALYNCVVYGFRYGVRDVTGSTVSSYDCAVFNNTDDFYGTQAAVDYCASDDNDGTHNVAESGGGASWTNDFTDAANGDFTLKTGSALLGAGGKAGSSYFSTDIEGTSRGDAWDLGAYEKPAATSYTYAGSIAISTLPNTPAADLWADSLLKWMNEGETSIGNVYLRGQAQPDLYLGLYTNSTEPGEAATVADLTEPSADHGYARAQLADGNWTETSQGTFTNLQKTFACSGTAWGNVYGWFITTTATGTSGKLITAEHFSDGPYDVAVGSTVKVTPKVSFT